jgi:hypothetical protein
MPRADHRKTSRLPKAKADKVAQALHDAAKAARAQAKAKKDASHSTGH